MVGQAGVRLNVKGVVLKKTIFVACASRLIALGGMLTVVAMLAAFRIL